jgi:hypothetical protein
MVIPGSYNQGGPSGGSSSGPSKGRGYGPNLIKSKLNLKNIRFIIDTFWKLIVK